MRKGIILFCVMIVGLIFSCFSLADNSTVSVSMDPGKVIADIKPNSIGGMNVNNSMVLVKIKAMLDPLKISTITYPAGNIADDEIGNTNSDYALALFRRQQERLGNPFTFVQVRLYKGTPEGAAEAVREAARQKLKVDVWSIGNEPDLYSPNKGDHSWTIEKYCRSFREFVTAMRAVDPNIKVAGPLTCQPKDDWIEKFIYEDGDLVDVLAWHWYPTNGKWSNENALATAPDIANQIQRYRSWLKDPQMNPKGYNRDIKLGLTEYAIHWDTPNFRHLTDMVGAMWTAEVVGLMAQNGLDYSHYFCLGNYGGHAIFEQAPSYMERPVYYVFRFFANHFGKHMVASSSADASVKVFASKDDQGKRYMILINQNPKEKKDIKLELADKSSISKAVGYVLDNDHNGTKLDTKSLKVVNGQLSVVLPPYSVTTVEF
ncbi:MAG TPA: hypothetical protein VHR47_01675 [Bacillota bacterium]|nr:hypothetical protein [Bacillota bacterium]